MWLPYLFFPLRPWWILALSISIFSEPSDASCVVAASTLSSSTLGHIVMPGVRLITWVLLVSSRALSSLCCTTATSTVKNTSFYSLSLQYFWLQLVVYVCFMKNSTIKIFVRWGQLFSLRLDSVAYSLLQLASSNLVLPRSQNVFSYASFSGRLFSTSPELWSTVSVFQRPLLLANLIFWATPTRSSMFWWWWLHSYTCGQLWALTFSNIRILVAQVGFFDQGISNTRVQSRILINVIFSAIHRIMQDITWDVGKWDNFDGGFRRIFDNVRKRASRYGHHFWKASRCDSKALN